MIRNDRPEILHIPRYRAPFQLHPDTHVSAARLIVTICSRFLLSPPPPRPLFLLLCELIRVPFRLQIAAIRRYIIPGNKMFKLKLYRQN